jgi:hypothetical protein
MELVQVTIPRIVTVVGFKADVQINLEEGKIFFATVSPSISTLAMLIILYRPTILTVSILRL